MYLNIVNSLWVDIKVTSPFQLLKTILQEITFMTDPFRIMAQNTFDELVLKTHPNLHIFLCPQTKEFFFLVIEFKPCNTLNEGPYRCCCKHSSPYGTVEKGRKTVA